MHESPEEAFEKKLNADLSTKSEVLDAVKESLVHIMDKYSIPSDLMLNAGNAIKQAFERYSRAASGEDELLQLSNLAHDMLEEKLAEKNMHVPEIMKEFEKDLADRLPE